MPRPGLIGSDAALTPRGRPADLPETCGYRPGANGGDGTRNCFPAAAPVIPGAGGIGRAIYRALKNSGYTPAAAPVTTGMIPDWVR
jgi:hypothetical protein